MVGSLAITPKTALSRSKKIQPAWQSTSSSAGIQPLSFLGLLGMLKHEAGALPILGKGAGTLAIQGNNQPALAGILQVRLPEELP